MYLANHANLSIFFIFFYCHVDSVMCCSCVFMSFVVICCAGLLNLYENLNRQTSSSFSGGGGNFDLVYYVINTYNNMYLNVDIFSNKKMSIMHFIRTEL